MLEHADIRSKGIPLLFFANKMDRPQAISAVECARRPSAADARTRARTPPRAPNRLSLLAGCVSSCVTSLELDKITDHPWHIAQSNALTGEGLDDGITWLSNQLARGMRKN